MLSIVSVPNKAKTAFSPHPPHNRPAKKSVVALCCFNFWSLEWPELLTENKFRFIRGVSVGISCWKEERWHSYRDACCGTAQWGQQMASEVPIFVGFFVSVLAHLIRSSTHSSSCNFSFVTFLLHEMMGKVCLLKLQKSTLFSREAFTPPQLNLLSGW